MKKLLLTLCALFVLTYNQPAYANEVVVTNEDVLIDASTIKDVDIESEKGTTFRALVPILAGYSSSSWEKYKYNDYYMSLSVYLTADFTSNEQIRISVTEPITMKADGGLKEDIEWLAYIPYGYTHSGVITNASSKNAYIEGEQMYSQSIWVKPNKDTTAGLWRGFVTTQINIEEYAHTLSKEQFMTYLNFDVNSTEITIPKYINVNGKNLKVGGLGRSALSDFKNLKDIYLEADDRFNFSSVFYESALETDSITIHANNIPVMMDGNTYLNTSILYDGCQLIIGNNPFNGTYQSPPDEYGNYFKYNDVDTIDMENALSVIRLYGKFTDLHINPDIKYIDAYAFQYTTIDKLYIPNFKYLNGYSYAMFGGVKAKEAEIDNYYVGKEWFARSDTLQKVVLTDNVEYISQEAFLNCSSLTEVVIPESVKYIDPSAFAGTPFLENLKKGVEKVYINGCFVGYGELYQQGSYYEFPAEIETLSSAFVSDSVTHLAFEPTSKYVNVAGTFPKIKTLDLTGRNLNGSVSYNFPNVNHLILGGQKKYSGNYEGNRILTDIDLVDGLEYISDYAFNHVENYNESSIYIPASVYAIGGYSTTKLYSSEGVNEGRYGSGWSNHVFYNFGKDGVFKEFIVDEDSEYYTTVDGVLYTKDLQALVAVPRAAEFENGVFMLPNEVKRLGELSFSRNKNITELVISDNLEIFNNETELEDYYKSAYCDYISCLNSGNSLSIATYQYTNISKYTTRETNPNYTSIDGILYTKDLKELVAVPNHYQGVVNIPEGCEKIRENAFWLDSSGGYVHSGITGVSIPSTMKSIDPDQLSYINYHWASKTTIAKGCRSYVRFGGRTLVVSDMNNIAYNGGTGTLWFNTSSGYIGTDSAPAWARYEPFYLPEGDYVISFNNPSPEKTVRYNGVLANGDGISITLNAATTKINYTNEPTELTVGENGVIVFFNGIFVDTTNNNQAIYSSTNAEIANEIISLMNIHKHEYQAKEHLDTSCSNDGYDLYECSCGKSYSDIYDSFEHNFVDGVCTVCGNTDVYHESAEAGIYDKYGALTYTWDELLNEGLITTKNDNEIVSVSTSLEGKIVVPDTITIISNLAFKDSKFTDIILPNGLTCIANYAFQNSKNLKSIDIPDNTVMWNYVFMGCTSLESLKIGNSVEYIGISTFQGCVNLTEVEIPNSVTSMSKNAFSWCTNLKKITLPEGLTKLDEMAFYNCNNLSDINIPSTITTINGHVFRSTAITEFMWPENITIINSWMFNNTKLKSFVVPSTVTEIKDKAFENCTDLEAVYFEGDTLPTIDMSAFKKNSGKVCTFYFRNAEAAAAFTTDYYNVNYGIISDDYDW